MRKALIIARKDISSYFYSWLGILIFVFLYVMTGVLFSLLVTSYSRISFEVVHHGFEGAKGIRMTHFIFGSFFLNLGISMIFLAPLISMRSFAEEKANQTLEILFTYPLSDFDVVFGKFLGLFWFMVLLILPTLGYFGIFYWLGGILDIGPVISCYLGLFLLVSAFLSLGLFVSSLTASQVTSAIVTFSALALLWALEWVGGIVDGDWAQWVQILSPLSHFREFTFGIIDLSHVAYFLFFSLFFLFLALRSVETRHWKN